MDKIGLDIPTAVYMFLKAVVREQCLPISTNVAVPDPEKKIVEETMNFYTKLLCYIPPNGDSENMVTVLPLESGNNIKPEMYIQLVCKVPTGYITCRSNMISYLERIYNKEVNIPSFDSLPYMDIKNNMIPYWRVVSDKGILFEGRGGSRESIKEHLTEEKIPVVQRGSMEGSYKVENYEKYMFNYDTLQIRYANSDT